MDPQCWSTLKILRYKTLRIKRSFVKKACRLRCNILTVFSKPYYTLGAKLCSTLPSPIIKFLGIDYGTRTKYQSIQNVFVNLIGIFIINNLIKDDANFILFAKFQEMFYIHIKIFFIYNGIISSLETKALH